MLLNKYFISALLLFFLIYNGKAQFNTIPSISEKQLKRHVSFLASDSLQGRELGSPGIEIAADYLRTEAIKAGLKPADKDYFQNFKLLSSHPDIQNSRITKSNSDKVLIDSVICLNQYTESLKIKGEIVFAGFGFQNEKSGYDDLKNVEVAEKIVICAVGSPEIFNSDKELRWSYRLENSKADRLFQKGASAVIFVTNAKNTANKDFLRMYNRRNQQRFSIKPDNVSTLNKVFITVPEFADNIFGEKGAYKNYLVEIANRNLPKPGSPENLETEIQSSVFLKQKKAKNIIGWIEGADPEMKKEYVVYMAHYDHLGVNSEGEVFNGADDNASGVAALLEIARVFSSEKIKPKRSIVFLWLTGEEKGMLGSGYYIENPAFPIDKTIACINLDMIGRVYEPRDSVWNESPKKVKNIDGVYALISDFNSKLINFTDSISEKHGLKPDKSLPSYFFRSSDHYHFHSRGVPIVNLSTGYHADYHKVTDEVSRIRFDKMKRVAELSFWVGYKMAGN